MSSGTFYPMLLSAICLAFAPHLARATVRQNVVKQQVNRLAEVMAAKGKQDLSAQSGLSQQQLLQAAASLDEENTGYTTNAICRQFNCINPIVPGMTDLLALNATVWQCREYSDAKAYLNFCKDAILYDIAVPDVPNTTTVEAVITEQDNLASTAYFYALAGMNLEPWQLRKPAESTSDCAKSIWNTVCSTYFPRAQAGCKNGEKTPYLRPCKNVCESYISACGVQCCDESVQCVFSKKVSLLDGNSTIVTGYANELGPSATCTGGSFSGAASTGLSMSVLLVAWLSQMVAGQD